MELKHIPLPQWHKLYPPFNRTLWNWNYVIRYQNTNGKNLLIVPYGIETKFQPVECGAASWLLIVPYGIETEFLVRVEELHFLLLIVPYGIETNRNNTQVLCQMTLLIVPYGIETWSIFVWLFFIHTFNRTLWNWNKRILGRVDGTGLTFNRTLWNWNLHDSKPTKNIQHF